MRNRSSFPRFTHSRTSSSNRLRSPRFVAREKRREREREKERQIEREKQGKEERASEREGGRERERERKKSEETPGRKKEKEKGKKKEGETGLLFFVHCPLIDAQSRAKESHTPGGSRQRADSSHFLSRFLSKMSRPTASTDLRVHRSDRTLVRGSTHDVARPRTGHCVVVASRHSNLVSSARAVEKRALASPRSDQTRPPRTASKNNFSLLIPKRGRAISPAERKRERTACTRERDARPLTRAIHSRSLAHRYLFLFSPSFLPSFLPSSSAFNEGNVGNVENERSGGGRTIREEASHRFRVAAEWPRVVFRKRSSRRLAMLRFSVH